jgi:hypothetical protein
LQIVGLDFRVEDERIDAGPLSRQLVGVLEAPGDVVARCHVAQRVPVVGDQHQPHPGPGEDGGGTADHALDARLQADAVAIRKLEVDQAPGEGLVVHMGLPRRRMARGATPPVPSDWRG